MSSLLIIIICMGLGVTFRQIPKFPTDVHKGLNAFVIWVSLPAVSLMNVPQISWSPDMLFPAIMPWIVFALTYLVVRLAARPFGLSRQTEGCLILGAGLCNTSFVGFPLLEFVYGDARAMPVAILCDQVGSFFAVSTLGIIIASYYSGGSGVTAGQLVRKIVVFPPFVAFVVALLITPLGGLPAVFAPVVQRLGDAMSPLALFSIGLQIKLGRNDWAWGALGTGLLCKLLLAPTCIYLIYKYIFELNELVLGVSVLESAMPSMITGLIIASDHGLDPDLAGALAAVGIPLSLLTVYAWGLLVV